MEPNYASCRMPVPCPIHVILHAFTPRRVERPIASLEERSSEHKLAQSGTGRLIARWLHRCNHHALLLFEKSAFEKGVIELSSVQAIELSSLSRAGYRNPRRQEGSMMCSRLHVRGHEGEGGATVRRTNEAQPSLRGGYGHCEAVPAVV